MGNSNVGEYDSLLEKHMNAAQAPPTPGSPVVGLDAIGRLFGRTRWTIRRWIDEENFPAAWLPNGQWCTTTTLIDQWILDRAEAQWDDGD